MIYSNILANKYVWGIRISIAIQGEWVKVEKDPICSLVNDNDYMISDNQLQPGSFSTCNIYNSFIMYWLRIVWGTWKSLFNCQVMICQYGVIDVTVITKRHLTWHS